jgi:hypothetical protein
MTPTQEYLNRYKETAKEADSHGRIITVGRLRVSQQIKISEMTPGLDGNTEMTGPNGEQYSIPRRGIPLLAASVRQVDDFMVSFPRNRAELDNIMDMLDEHGISATLIATTKLNPSAQQNLEQPDATDTVDEAKK